MKFLFVAVLALIATLVYFLYEPVREFRRIPSRHVSSRFSYPEIEYDPAKRTVILLADNKGTEIFDLVAPYHLFKRTGQFNVFIVAKHRAPVAVMKGFFTLPHLSLAQADSMSIKPSVLVIPNLSGTPRKQQDREVLKWISGKSRDSVKLLAICAGSVTAAATGLYDEKAMTTHASEMEDNQAQFKGPRWVKGLSYTKAGNFFSTAGVSNAVEGSLAVIEEILGKAAARKLMEEIAYPYSYINRSHQALALSGSGKFSILKKVLLDKDPNIVFLLQEGVDEFSLAASMDAYHRTFPKSLKTFSMGQKPVVSRFGMVLLPTGDASDLRLANEVHVLSGERLSDHEAGLLQGKKLVHYPAGKQYIFDVCLERIGLEYGRPMQTVVKRLLDYN